MSSALRKKVIGTLKEVKEHAFPTAPSKKALNAALESLKKNATPTRGHHGGAKTRRRGARKTRHLRR
jgi:hypothetical protein